MTYRASQDSTESLTAAEVAVSIVGQANLTATTNPTTSDDCTAGYQIGSRWLNTSLGNWYLCTSAATGNAVWQQITGISEGDVPTIPLGSSEGITSLQPFDGDTELDLDASDHIVLDAPYVELHGNPADIRSQAGVDIYIQSADNGESSASGGAWLFSGNADGGATGDTGVGSGNSNTGQTGTVAVYTGDSGGGTGLIGISTGHATGGDSGNIGIVTGDADSGNSGNIELRIGSADSQRGSIILNAPNFSAPNGFHLLSASNPIQLLIQNAPADNGDGSGITLVAGPGGGDSGNGGAIQLISGEAPNGISGNITLATGAASTRGNIILDAPNIRFNDPDFVALWTLDATDTDSVGIWLSSGGTSGTGSTGLAGIGSGDCSGTGNTGWSQLSSGNAPGGSTGEVNVSTGQAGAGNSGNINISTGGATGTRGSIVLDGPMIKRGSSQWYADPGVGFDIECSNEDNTGDASASAAGVYLQAGIAVSLGKGGDAWIQAGDGGSTGGNGGLAGIQGGQSTCAGATGGELHLVGGQASVADANGGAILIQSGQGQGTGNSGNITIQTGVVDAGTRGHIIVGGLPTSDPHVDGALWNSSGDLKISAG